MKTFPAWLKKPVIKGDGFNRVEQALKSGGINTVCKSARCPNIFECFSAGHATFMILGNVCTRSCGFCSVSAGSQPAIDNGEPLKIAAAIKELGMAYVIITSVTRDDIPDGGAAHFAGTVRNIRAVSPEVKIEVLVPDFGGDISSVEAVISSAPDVFGHNLETVPRLYPAVRRNADYARSLGVLSAANKKDARIKTKSGIMLGLGETKEEVIGVLKDLRGVGVSSVVIGQYLKPSSDCIDVSEFIHPDDFKMYADMARGLGFSKVLSEPFARSSYKIFNGGEKDGKGCAA